MKGFATLHEDMAQPFSQFSWLQKAHKILDWEFFAVNLSKESFDKRTFLPLNVLKLCL